MKYKQTQNQEATTNQTNPVLNLTKMLRPQQVDTFLKQLSGELLYKYTCKCRSQRKSLDAQP